MQEKASESKNGSNSLASWFFNLKFAHGPYTKSTPTFISNNVSNYDEVGRWALDRRGVEYIDQSHAPGFYIPFVNSASGQSGGFNGPVYVSKETMVYTSINIIDYLDARVGPDQRLVPAEEPAAREVRELFEHYHVHVESPVANYVYASLLPHRSYSVPLFTDKVPWWESLAIHLFYGKFSKILWSGLQLSKDSRTRALAIVQAEFEKVSQRLADGRRYLTGDRFTAADMMFASAAAPCLMPEQYGGAIPSIDHIPEQMKGEVKALRETAAGQFVLRLYEEDRPARVPCAA